MRACPACDASVSTALIQQHGYALLQCSACDLIYVGNPPMPAELKAMYSFERGYHTGFRDDPALIEKFRNAARHHVTYLRRHSSGGRLLDVGCSAGFLMEAATHDGWETLGVELSHDTARLGREKGLDIIEGTVADVPEDAGPFDVVTMFDVLEHFEHPLRELQRVHALLDDGGLVVVSTPNADGLFARWLMVTSRWLREWLHAEPPFHLSQFTKRTLRFILGRAGFRVVDVYDERIPLTHVLGEPRAMLTSPSLMLTGLVGAPLSLIGPPLRRGDWMLAVARASRRSTR